MNYLKNKNRKITCSDSLEAVQDFQIIYWAELTREQRFADFYELMSRFYSFEKPVWNSKKIVIDDYVR